MAITKIENKNHTDDRKYSVGFNKKYSPVFYVLYDPIQEDGKPIPTNKLSYPLVHIMAVNKTLRNQNKLPYFVNYEGIDVNTAREMLKQVFRVFEKNYGECDILLIPIGPHRGVLNEKPLSSRAGELKGIFLNVKLHFTGL